MRVPTPLDRLPWEFAKDEFRAYLIDPTRLSGTLPPLSRKARSERGHSESASHAGWRRSPAANPWGVVLATDGNFYGTSYYSLGTVFKVTPSGTLTTLYSFGGDASPSGSFPGAALVQAADGNLCGTTVYGGANSCVFGGTDFGCGTAFKITPRALTTLYSFCSKSGCADGETPFSSLVQASNGNLYGTTPDGGTHGVGTVFEITTAGTLTTLHSFDGTDGEDPNAGLLQTPDGNLYGTTGGGGATYPMFGFRNKN